jgi:uncharacterized MAPEG superfamily protein
MMKVPLLCLVGFTLWVIVLVSAIGALRASQVLRGEAKPNGFPSGSPHGSAGYWRLNRAHANALESLPVFAALVLSAAVVGLQGNVVDQLCLVALGARLAQSSVHALGGSSWHVNARFFFFVVQLVCFVWLGLLIVATVI